MSDWLDPDSSIPLSTMLTAKFNQDGSCLAIGLEDGFEVFSMPPFQKSITRKLGGSLGQLEMLFRCHLFAIVGDSRSSSSSSSSPESHAHPYNHFPSYSPPNRVLIWDDHNLKAIGELTFRQHVLQVKLRRDAIAVALRDRVYVYNLRELTLRDKIYTTDNPHGLLTISTSTSTTRMGGTASSSSNSPLQDMVLACPSVTEGHVRVELYGWRKTVLIPAHESALRAIALTPDGTRLATASSKGTVIRVFSIHTSGPPPQLLQEFRRGIDRVQMTCLAWSWDHRHVACCSDKGTAHVFQMKDISQTTEVNSDITSTSTNNNNNNNTQSTRKSSNNKESSKSSWYRSLRQTIFSSDLKHSISQIRGIPHPIACTFVPNLPNTLAVVGWDVDGNGVLSLSDYSTEEAIRTGYHVIAKAVMDPPSPSAADEGTIRRKRMLPSNNNHNTKEHNTTIKDSDNNDINSPIVVIGDRMELLEHQKQEIQFQEEEDDEGFLNILGLEHKCFDESISDNKKNDDNPNDVNDDDDVNNDKDDDEFQDTPQE